MLCNKIKKEWGIEILQEKRKIKRRKDIVDLSPLEQVAFMTQQN